LRICWRPSGPSGNHALHRFLDHALGKTAFEDLAGRALLDAAGIAGVPVVDFLVALGAGQFHLAGIDDDDVVAVIDMGREARFVLAAQAIGDDAGETTEHHILGVDQHPLLHHVRRLLRECSHRSVPGSGRRLPQNKRPAARRAVGERSRRQFRCCQSSREDLTAKKSILFMELIERY